MKFDYGDTVVVTEAEENGPRCGQPCAVVGMTLIETEAQARVFGHPVGTTMYTVECEGKPDAEVPEALLRPI
jgi:hypothetical protein